jgi:hypothetical protein
MDQEVFSRLVSEVELLRISTEEITARILTLRDVDLDIDTHQLQPLRCESATEQDALNHWLIRL